MRTALVEKKRATYEDLLRAPDHLTAEILDGKLYVTPRPATPHMFAHSALHALLKPPFQWGRGGPGGWWVLFEPELHLDEDVLVPDLAAWRRERLPRAPKKVGLTVAPDWACEVLSPSTTHIDRGLKMRICARERVSHFWLVDPVKETLEIFRLKRGSWLPVGTHQGNAVVRGEPFDAIELDLSLVWERPEEEEDDF